MTEAPTLSLPDVTGALAGCGLSLLGGLHPEPDAPHLPPGTGTLLLLGPGEPGFWSRVTASPEFADGAADPLDRWSRRVIGDLARALGGTALFPFGGPPWLPFLDWATRSGAFWSSPVGMLVHAEAGLMVSIRGALALGPRLALPAPPPKPCDTCAAQPCRTACPVDALGPKGYDVAACRGWLDGPAGTDCLDIGCAARRACPVSRTYPRDPAQSAFHMRAFHGSR